MYYIRKYLEEWAVHNKKTQKSRSLSEIEVQKLMDEFPNLKFNANTSRSLTYFRNHISSISNLP